MRRVSRSRSLAQVAIALVMYKLKRGGVGRRGAQCAVACRAAFFLVVGCCRGSAFACKAAEVKPETALGRIRVAAWGCLHFTNSQTIKCEKRYKMPWSCGLLHSLIIYVLLPILHCRSDQWITCAIREYVVLTFLSLLASHGTISEGFLRPSWYFHYYSMYMLNKACEQAAVPNVVGLTCCFPVCHQTLRVGVQGTSLDPRYSSGPVDRAAMYT